MSSTLVQSYKIISSPVGDLILMANADTLTAVMWADRHQSMANEQTVENINHPVLKQAEQELKEYFKGQRKKFSVPFQLGGTKFQIQTWTALTKIPYGRTWSYGEQAKKIGRPKAVRAVGGTNGKNPISIIIPCHRVIGKNGHLTGFGGGLKNKQFLLELEQRHL